MPGKRIRNGRTVYTARRRVNGAAYYLGSYATLEEAERAERDFDLESHCPTLTPIIGEAVKLIGANNVNLLIKNGIRFHRSESRGLVRPRLVPVREVPEGA